MTIDWDPDSKAVTADFSAWLNENAFDLSDPEFRGILVALLQYLHEQLETTLPELLLRGMLRLVLETREC